MNRFNIIRHIRSLKRPATPNAEWLFDDRKKLIDFMRMHPAMVHSDVIRKSRRSPGLFRAGGIAALALVLTTTSVAFAAQNALPGDSLFAVKKIMERAALAAPLSADQRSAIGLSFAERRIDELSSLKERKGELTQEVVEKNMLAYRDLVELASRAAQEASVKDKEGALALMLNVEREVGQHKNKMKKIDEKMADRFDEKDAPLLREIENSATDFEIDLGIISSASVRNVRTKGAEERIRGRINRSEQELEHMAEFDGEALVDDLISLNEARIQTNEKKMKEAFETVKKLEYRLDERLKKNKKIKEKAQDQNNDLRDADKKSDRVVEPPADGIEEQIGVSVPIGVQGIEAESHQEGPGGGGADSRSEED